MVNELIINDFMNTAIIIVISAVVGLLLGAGIYFLISRIAAANLIKKAEQEAEMMNNPFS